jgi:hypothetical protein
MEEQQEKNLLSKQKQEMEWAIAVLAGYYRPEPQRLILVSSPKKYSFSRGVFFLTRGVLPFAFAQGKTKRPPARTFIIQNDQCVNIILVGYIFQIVGPGRRLDVKLYVLDVPSRDFNPFRWDEDLRGFLFIYPPIWVHCL